MHAAEKRLDDLTEGKWVLFQGMMWESCISQFFGRAEHPNSILLSELKRQIERVKEKIKFPSQYDEMRMENEIEDTDIRLKRGSDLGRFDQFWEDEALFSFSAYILRLTLHHLKSTCAL
jgi:hypothetical protein